MQRLDSFLEGNHQDFSRIFSACQRHKMILIQLICFEKYYVFTAKIENEKKVFICL